MMNPLSMKLPLRFIQFCTIGVFIHACAANVDSTDNTIPDPDPQPAIIQPEWEIYQRSSADNGNAESWGLDIQNGKIYWAVSQIMPATQMDVTLHQLEFDGTQIWAEEIVTNQFTDQAYILSLTDSIAYIGGRTCKEPAGIQSCDALLAKADPETGAIISEISWDQGFGYEEVDGIVPQPSGLLVSGWTFGENTGMDLFLQKYDHEDNLQWTETWSSPGNRDDHQDGHVVVDNAYVYMAGLYNGSPGLGWNGRSLILKVDKNTGSLADSVTFGRQDPWVNAENALGLNTDGEFLYVTGYTTPSTNNWDIFVAKYDKDLNRIWYTTWGGDDTESARSLVIDNSGDIFVAGTTVSYGEGGFEVVLLKLNPSGEIDWYRTWGASGDDNAFDIQIHDNSVYITGRTNSFHPIGKNEAFLIKENID